MRLEIHCADRIGIAQEILNILVSYQVDLKGIEVDSVKLPNVCVISTNRVRTISKNHA